MTSVKKKKNLLFVSRLSSLNPTSRLTCDVLLTQTGPNSGKNFNYSSTGNKPCYFLLCF